MKRSRPRRTPRATPVPVLVHATPDMRNPAGVPVARLVPALVPERKPEPVPAPVQRASRAYRLRVRVQRAIRRRGQTKDAAPITPGQRPRVISTARWFALLLISITVVATTAVAFVESYNDLYGWFLDHGFSKGWARLAPLQIDTFVIIGELALFIGIVDHWKGHHRLWAWTIVMGGLGVSVAGNVGHVSPDKPWTFQATAAIPPVASMLGMTIGFQVLKRVMVTIAERQTAERQVADNQPASTMTVEPVEDVRPEPAPALEIPQPRPEPRALVMGTNGQPTAWDVTPEPTPDDKEGEPFSKIWTPVKESGEPRTQPAPKPRAKRNGRHPRWDEAVAAYRESQAEVLEGRRERPFSQRELAAALGMQNRSLAAKVIDHVTNGGE